MRVFPASVLLQQAALGALGNRLGPGKWMRPDPPFQAALNSPHDFQDFECTGTQLSRRLASETVEILRHCGAGASTRFIRRASAKPNELVLEITEQQSDGHRFERRLVLKR